jgi:hypothetical protein
METKNSQRLATREPGKAVALGRVLALTRPILMISLSIDVVMAG